MNSEPILLSHEISALVHHVELNRTGWWDEALSGIVLASVWSFDRPVNAEQIVSELEKSFRLPVGRQQLSLVIKKLTENDRIIEVGGGKFKVSEQLRVTLDNDVEAAKDVRTNARSYFESLVMDSAIDIDPPTMWEAFERVFLIPMMRDIGANTYKLIAGDGQAYDQSHIDSFLSTFDDENPAIIKAIVSQFLDPKNGIVRDYVTRILHAYFCVEASGLPKSVLDKLRKTMARPLRFRLFVDTNFLFSWLDLHENPSNSSAQELRELLVTLKSNPRVDLYLTSRTMKEAKSAISAAKACVSSVPVDDNFTLAALRAGMSGMSARFFSERQRRSDPLDADTWFDPYLNDLVPMSRQVGVRSYNKKIDQYGTRQDVIDDIQLVMEHETKALPEGRRKSYERVAHDVILWHVVEDRRPSYAESPADVEDWILTVDFRLIGFDAYKRKNSGSNVPVCLHPTTLVQLLRFWVPRSKEFEEAILGGLRFPFLFQEFDAEAERLSLTIISRLGRFQGSDQLSDDTLVKVVMNDGLRLRIREDIPEDEEVKLVQDALLDELRLKVEAEEKRTKELQRALENRNIAFEERSNVLRGLRRSGKEKDALIDELNATIAEKDRTLDETMAKICDLESRQGRISKELERSERESVRRSLRTYYAILLVSVVLSVVVGSFAYFTLPIFDRDFGTRLAYVIVGFVAFLLLHLLVEKTIGRFDKFKRLRPFLQMTRLRKWLWGSVISALFVGIVVNLISGGL